MPASARLQALSGLGQIVGLLLAGFIGGRYALAFGIAAALVAAAMPIAWLTLRGVQVAVPRAAAAAHPPLGGEGWVGSPQRQSHLPTWSGFRDAAARTRNAIRALADRLVRGFRRDQRGADDVSAGVYTGVHRLARGCPPPPTPLPRPPAWDLSIGGQHRETSRGAARAPVRFCRARDRHRDPGRPLRGGDGWRAAGAGRVCRSGSGLAAAGSQRYGARRANLRPARRARRSAFSMPARRWREPSARSSGARLWRLPATARFA